MSIKRTGPLFFKPAKKTNTARAQAPELLLTIDRLSAEGRGMAFVEQKAIFVANCLPGETVRVRLLEEKREHAVAELLEVVEAAPQRQTPRCPHFAGSVTVGSCGGCQLQMLDYARQVAHKQQTVAHLLAPFAPRHWDQALTADPWHYRHRARLSVTADAQGRPQLGFKSANSHRIVAIRHCDIIDKRLLPLLEQIPQWLTQLSKWQRIKEITLVVDANGQLALAYQAESAFPALDRALLQQLCKTANVLIADKNALLHYAIPSENLQLNFHARDFTQVNPAINDLLVARCRAWLNLQSSDNVVDFFCGLGNFSLPIARHCQRVSGFELDADMVRRATQNAATAGVDNIVFATEDLFATSDLAMVGFNKALLDPPRAGAKWLCQQLAKSNLQSVLYVSCNPHTLVRDLEALVAGGFRVERAALVDMFPQTGHIEAMVLCVR